MAIGRPVCANVICNSARACQFHETIKAWIVNCRHISCDVSPNVCSIEILQSSGNSGKKLPWSTFHPNLPSENRFSTNLSYWRNRHLLKTGHFRVQALKKKKAAAGKKAAPSDAVKAAAAEAWHGRRNGRRNVSEDSGDSSPNGRFKFYLPGLENVYITMKNHHFQWVNPLFLWPFSIAMLVYQRVCSSYWTLIQPDNCQVFLVGGFNIWIYLIHVNKNTLKPCRHPNKISANRVSGDLGKLWHVCLSE